ncbi:AIPR family protein [Streptomyces sp. NPDC087769]|uniref:AIPR family protein n=1 Tax=Streptomyces sp. NPDC087769 TaxID=3365802 RepID=UPI00381E7263
MKDLQVRQLESELTTQFSGFIDLSDLNGRPERIQRNSFLSRALAALAVHVLTGMDPERSAKCVIDSFDDWGIDAIAVDADSDIPQIWVVQAKWSENGTATFDGDALRALEDGFRKLVRGEYNRFNRRIDPLLPDLDAALNNARTKIVLAPALAGDQVLSPNVLRGLSDLCDQFDSEVMRVEPLLLSDFISSIRAGIHDPKVNLKAKMSDLRFLEDPYLAYFGNISGDQVANWYATERHRLFRRNIRYPLGLNKVNSGIVETLLREPESFWYFHNGITVLCDSMESGLRGDLELFGASVVNGAQTVASIHEAHERNPGSVAKARIAVRVIPLQGTPKNFDRRVTVATNTQNGVAQQDFRALDKIQARLRYEFDVVLDRKYANKRGESIPSPSAGCGILEAAVALACSHANAEMSFRANSEERRLWSDDTYFEIFNRPDALKTWRAVQVVREVESALEATQSDREGRAAALAEQGRNLLAHIFFQENPEWSKLADDDWESLIQSIPSKVDGILRWVMDCIDSGVAETSQIWSVFRTARRYSVIVAAVRKGLRSGRPVPQLSADYRADERERRARQANAVTVIVDAGAIEEGTYLEFRPATKPERKALAAWVSGDPRRSRATWVDDKSNSLLWEWDGERYSPSRLVQVMFGQAGKQIPKAVQGTRRWFVPDRGSLVDIANSIRNESED